MSHSVKRVAKETHSKVWCSADVWCVAEKSPSVLESQSLLSSTPLPGVMVLVAETLNNLSVKSLNPGQRFNKRLTLSNC